MATQLQYAATGRRKNAIARVRLIPGEGKFIINKRELAEYFGKKTLEMIVQQPFNITDTLAKYDVIALAHGGNYWPSWCNSFRNCSCFVKGRY